MRLHPCVDHLTQTLISQSYQGFRKPAAASLNFQGALLGRGDGPHSACYEVGRGSSTLPVPVGNTLERSSVSTFPKT